MNEHNTTLNTEHNLITTEDADGCLDMLISMKAVADGEGEPVGIEFTFVEPVEGRGNSVEVADEATVKESVHFLTLKEMEFFATLAKEVLVEAAVDKLVVDLTTDRDLDPASEDEEVDADLTLACMWFRDEDGEEFPLAPDVPYADIELNRFELELFDSLVDRSTEELLAMLADEQNETRRRVINIRIMVLSAAKNFVVDTATERTHACDLTDDGTRGILHSIDILKARRSTVHATPALIEISLAEELALREALGQHIERRRQKGDLEALEALQDRLTRVERQYAVTGAPFLTEQAASLRMKMGLVRWLEAAAKESVVGSA